MREGAVMTDSKNPNGSANTVSQTSSDAAVASKKKSNKGKIIGIVVAVVAVLGIAFWTWHSQPSFCNAVCHTPMDPYVQTYESGDSAMLSAVHAKAGKICLDCHEAKFDEQVHEATAWVSGNYQNPIPENTFEYDETFCLNKACHNMTRDELTQKTADMTFNPHVTQHGDIACSTCHKAHSDSVMYCTECHAAAQTPDGWLTWDEYQQSKQGK